MTTDFSVIDQMFSAMLSQNESKATIDALRPKVEAAVKELIRQRGLPKNFTGTIEYNGINIRVQRPRSYTWEHNYNPDVTGDPNHAIYLQQLELQKRMQAASVAPICRTRRCPVLGSFSPELGSAAGVQFPAVFRRVQSLRWLLGASVPSKPGPRTASLPCHPHG